MNATTPTPATSATLHPSRDDHDREVAATIRSQIEVGVFMSLGAHQLRHASHRGAEGYDSPALVFNARILPFKADGSRSESARIMQVAVVLNGLDLYEVTASYATAGKITVHFHADNITAFDLNRVLLSLDYDGPEVQNPRYA